MIDSNNLANYPVKTVLRSLFDVNNVDLVADAEECKKYFEQRLSKKCCSKFYKTLLFEFTLKDHKEMMDDCRALTKKR